MYQIRTIPTHFQHWGFNAGVVPRPYGFLVADRIQDGKAWSILLRQFDHNWNEFSWSKHPNLYGMEDMRLIVPPNNPDLVIGYGTMLTYTDNFNFAKIGLGAAYIEDMSPPIHAESFNMTADFKMQTVEKNWQMFFGEDHLHAIYSIEPHIICDVNLQDFSCKRRCISSMVSHPWKWGELRGGAPPIWIGDRWLVPFHSRMTAATFSSMYPDHHRRLQKKLYYFAGFYTFEDKEPYRVLSISNRPVNDMLPMTVECAERCLNLAGVAHWSNNHDVNVIFPVNGWRDNDHLMLVYGENDSRTCIARLPLAEVLANMEPVETKSSPFGKLHA